MIDILIYLLVVRSIINNVCTALTIRQLAKTLASIDEKHSLAVEKKLFLVLPVFDEEKLIKQSIDYIYERIGSRDNIYLYVVGTARERNDLGVNPTLHMAKQLCAEKSGIRIIEDPRPSGWMAQQVNYAVEVIRAEGKHLGNYWMFLVNIDSRFSAKAVDRLIGNINSGVQIIQQSAVFLSNFSSLKGIQKGFALWQSRWTITHEIPRLVFNRFNKLFLMHVVGHGLCINLEKFVYYGGLSEETPTEDLNIGFFLATAGETVMPLWILELADSPNDFVDAMRQKYTWSFGPMLYPIYMSIYRRRFPEQWRSVRIRAFCIMLQGVSSFIDWTVCSWVLAGVVLYSLFSPSALAFLCLYFLEYFQCNFYFYARNYIGFKDLVFSPLSVFAAGLFHSIPANIALINKVTGLSSVSRFKTPHR